MKTKFSPVVKLRQNKLDDIEMHLSAARAHKNMLEMRLERAKMLLANEVFPKSGNSATLQIALSTHALLISELEELKQKIAHVTNQIYQLENAYKTAFVELEKMKYLETEEIKRILKERDKIAAKELDEIATQRFYSLNKAQP